MAELVPAVDDVCTYNGVTFGPKMETLAISIVPVPDGSGRTVAYNRYTITIRSWVYNEPLGTADDDMPDLRTRLTEYGKELHYENKGLGAGPDGLRINLADGSGTRDVVWGPKPRLLKFKPVGASKVAEIEWTVEVCIPDCEVAKYEFRLMEFVFRLTFNIDASGYTRRNYSGYLRIPQTHAGGAARGRVIDSADRYRDRIYPKPLPGFRRVSADFPLSEDRCRLDYNIIDEMMPLNIPPPGIISATAHHSISTNTFLATTARWNGTISASYEVARDQDKALALTAFMKLLNDRREIILKNLAALDDGGRYVLINSLQMSEPIYDRLTAEFSAGYQCTMSREAVLRGGSGQWTPLGDSNWNLWRAQLMRGPFNERGYAGLKHLPQDDIIIDLCTDDPAKTASGSVVAGPPKKASGSAGVKLKNDMPGARASYLIYRSSARVEVVDDLVELKPLPTLRSLPPTLRSIPPLQPINPVQPDLGGDFLSGTGRIPTPVPPALRQSAPPAAAGDQFVGRAAPADVPPSSTGGNPPSLQTRCRPSVVVYLEGSAVRAGYAVVPPALVSVGGLKAVPANRPGCGFVQELFADWFGVPIIAASWKFAYRLAGVPDGQMPLPPSPLVSR